MRVQAANPTRFKRIYRGLNRIYSSTEVELNLTCGSEILITTAAYPEYSCEWGETLGALDDSRYGAGVSPCPQTNMESPHLYDSADYKKGGASAVKVKAGALLYSGEDYLAELSAPEVSLDLQGLIDDSQFSEGLIQEIQGLSVDKNNVGSRGLGVSNMYNPLAYLPQPVHGASQFERPYPERTHDRGPVIKEEPNEGSHEVAPQEYSACARVGLGGGDGGYGGGGYSTCPPYSMTPTTIPGSDNLCKSPMMSPSSGKLIGGCKKPLDKGSEEYKRRRERNNIAVRKSREKAKARSRETEERVKKLIVDNDRLHKRCEQLTKEVAAFQNMFASMHCLPEHIRREINKQMDAFNQQHQNLVNM